MVKSNKITKILTMFLAVFMLCSVFTPTIFGAVDASTGKVVSYNDAGITADSIVIAMGGDTSSGYTNGNVTFKNGTLTVTTKGEELDLLTVASSGGTIYISPKNVEKAKQSDVSKAFRLFTDAMSEVGADPDTVTQIMQDIQDVDSSVSTIMLPLILEYTKADLYSAYKIVEPFMGVLNVILGVAAVGLILLLLFSTVMDMVYIGLPVWREAQNEKNHGKNPFGVSYEAMRTVQEIEKGIGGGDGEYRNAYLLYLKRRSLTYIVLAICIMYLICGGLSGIISFVLNLVTGITG